MFLRSMQYDAVKKEMDIGRGQLESLHNELKNKAKTVRELEEKLEVTIARLDVSDCKWDCFGVELS